MRSSDDAEKGEQTMSRRLLDAVGFVVCNLSQWRPSGQTEGMSDTYAVHPVIGVAAWLESKRKKGGRVSPEQEQFAAVHEAASRAFDAKGPTLLGLGVPAFVLGSYADCERFVVRCGLATVAPTGQVILQPQRGAVYFEWHRVHREEKARRLIARRARKHYPTQPKGTR